MSGFEYGLLIEYYRLKNLLREGWCRIGIDRPESVASHSWGMAMLALVHCPDELNKLQVLKLAIVHDLPEVEVGDITPHDGITARQKTELEQSAAKRLLFGELYELWCEYRDNETAEAKFVHRLDKLDMAIQAIAYENVKDTTEFIDSALKSLDVDDIDILRSIQVTSSEFTSTEH